MFLQGDGKNLAHQSHVQIARSPFSPYFWLSPPQCSTHHCLVDLYFHLFRDNAVAFADLKSVFDVANRDIILDQLDFNLISE